MRGYELSSLTIHWIAEAWVISFLNTVAFGEHSITNLIEVFNSGGEPWYFRCSDFCDSFGNDFEVRYCLGHIWVGGLALYVYIEVNLPPIVLDELRWTR